MFGRFWRRAMLLLTWSAFIVLNLISRKLFQKLGHGVTVHLTKDFITEVMGLPKDEIKFSKETIISNVAIKKFPKTTEE